MDDDNETCRGSKIDIPILLTLGLYGLAWEAFEWLIVSEWTLCASLVCAKSHTSARAVFAGSIVDVQLAGKKTGILAVSNASARCRLPYWSTQISLGVLCACIYRKKSYCKSIQICA